MTAIERLYGPCAPVAGVACLPGALESEHRIGAQWPAGADLAEQWLPLGRPCACRPAPAFVTRCFAAHAHDERIGRARFGSAGPDPDDPDPGVFAVALFDPESDAIWRFVVAGLDLCVEHVLERAGRERWHRLPFEPCDVAPSHAHRHHGVGVWRGPRASCLVDGTAERVDAQRCQVRERNLALALRGALAPERSLLSLERDLCAFADQIRERSVAVPCLCPSQLVSHPRERVKRAGPRGLDRDRDLISGIF